MASLSRRLLNPLTALSLLLYASAAALAVFADRSGFSVGWCRWVEGGTEWELESECYAVEATSGRLTVVRDSWNHWTDQPTTPVARSRFFCTGPPGALSGSHTPEQDATTYPLTAGFAVADVETYLSGRTRRRFQALLMPPWLPMALAAIPPVRIASSFLRRGVRAAAGRCAACGYDLRATPGRCTECGATPA
jgi:hypothetical protein